VRRLDPANLRAAWWALRTARRTRRLLAAEGLDAALGPPPPPLLPVEAERGAKAALRRRGQSCLVTAIVLQAWEAAHGRRRDLIVGVTSSSQFRAHAWLEGDPIPPAESLLDLGLSQLHDTWERDRAIFPREEQETADPAHPGFHELLRRPAPSE
jgi:hypothetical protein